MQNLLFDGIFVGQEMREKEREENKCTTKREYEISIKYYQHEIEINP